MKASLSCCFVEYCCFCYRTRSFIHCRNSREDSASQTSNRYCCCFIKMIRVSSETKFQLGLWQTDRQEKKNSRRLCFEAPSNAMFINSDNHLMNRNCNFTLIVYSKHDIHRLIHFLYKIYIYLGKNNVLKELIWINIKKFGRDKVSIVKKTVWSILNCTDVY